MDDAAPLAPALMDEAAPYRLTRPEPGAQTTPVISKNNFTLSRHNYNASSTFSVHSRIVTNIPRLWPTTRRGPGRSRGPSVKERAGVLLSARARRSVRVVRRFLCCPRRAFSRFVRRVGVGMPTRTGLDLA